MKIVRMLQSMAGPHLSLVPGDFVKVSDEIADAWKGGQVAEDAPEHVTADQAKDFALMAAYVDGEASPTAARASGEPATIPEDWEKLDADGMKDLAAAISGGKVKSKAAAIVIIETELEARAKAAASAGPES